MRNPRGFHQIQKEPSEKIRQKFFPGNRGWCPSAISKDYTQDLVHTWAAFILVGWFLLQLLAAKAEDFEYTTCCFLHCLQVRVPESDVLVVLGGRASVV